VGLEGKEPNNRDARDRHFPSRGAREKVNEDLQCPLKAWKRKWFTTHSLDRF